MDWSASPFNEGPWGTSEFADLLEAEGYRVYFGGPETAEGLYRAGVKPLYLVIGPDSYIPEGRAAEIAGLVERGYVSGLIVADETGNAMPLLRELGAPQPGEIIADPPIMSARCEGGVSMLVSKPATLEEAEGWRPVCWLEGGGVLAVERSVGGANVLVIADSSIFANFMVTGLPPLESTREAVLALVGRASGGSKVVVIDTGIHDLIELPGANVLVSAPLTAVSIAYLALSRPEVAAMASAVVFVVAVVLAVRRGRA
jgi:hypothetical protein